MRPPRFQWLRWPFAVALVCSPTSSLLAQEAPAPETAAPETPATEAPTEETPALEAPLPNEDLPSTVERLERRVDELEAKEAEREAAASAAAEGSPEGLSDRVSRVPDRKTFRDDHSAAPRPGNAPLDPKLKGFFPLGATGTWAKLGGYAKLDAIVDSREVGNRNKMVPSSIPTAGTVGFGEGAQFNLHAKQSRLSFETRTPTVLGSLRFVYENDFFADGLAPGMAYNLRHLYGQLKDLTVGQTWTLYLDADAIPDTLDFAGPGVQAILRQPQVRYTLPIKNEHLDVAVAIEQPTEDIAGTAAGTVPRNVVPDVTALFRLESRNKGHLHLAAVGRWLGVDDAEGNHSGAIGWSSNLSMVFHTFDRDDLTVNATLGQGTGHYAQDLGTGNAAVVDASGNVHALTTLGAFLGYRHFWAKKWHSQGTYAYLQLEDHEDLPVDAYYRTHYAQANLIWSYSDRFHLGGEYLYGRRTNHDGSKGEVHRGQFSLKFSPF